MRERLDLTIVWRVSTLVKRREIHTISPVNSTPAAMPPPLDPKTESKE